MLSAFEWHLKHHRLADGTVARTHECRRCIVAKAKCHDKIDYKSRECADKAALAINIERHWWPGACMKPYHCRYCMVWHLTTATREVDMKRVEKMRRKWMRRTNQKLKDEDYGYGDSLGQAG